LTSRWLLWRARLLSFALALLPFPALQATDTPAYPPPTTAPINLRFEQGTPGQVPQGWFVPPVLKDAGHSAELRRQGCRQPQGHCAVVLSSTSPQAGKFANLMQRVDAAKYRGKLIRLRAWLKEEPVAGQGQAQMWIRVDLPNKVVGLFDNMGDRPVTTAEWRQVEISGAVGADAELISFGVMAIGGGNAWVDSVEFEEVRNATAEEKAVKLDTSGKTPAAPAQPVAQTKSADGSSPVGPVNLRFEQGTPGQVPQGWSAARSNGYSAELRNKGCKNQGNCAVVIGPDSPPPNTFGNLMQGVNAAPYRGKVVRMRAWLRMDSKGPGDKAQLWFRVDRANQQMGFFDNMDNRPVVTAEWKRAEITGPIHSDAQSISIGVLDIGKGTAWVDSVEFEVLRDATPQDFAAVAGGPGQQVPAPSRRDMIVIPLALLLGVTLLVGMPVTRRWLRRTFVPELDADAPRWSLFTRVLFRLFFCDIVLHAIPSDPWYYVTPWVAVHLFHLSGNAITYKMSGSGDKALDYVLSFCLLALSVVMTVVWSILDHRRPNYHHLNVWLRLFVRYALAMILMGYGFAKIFPNQMPAPNFRRLLEPYGDFSPMGVVWAFIGTSMAYEIFSGAMEALGAAFLLFRRTALLGALVSFGVMVNVAMLNYCYDVPVKLFSTELLLLAAFIAAPDALRLIRFFLSRDTTPPPDSDPPSFRNRWMRLAGVALKTVVIGYLLFQNGVQGYQRYVRTYGNLDRPPIYGIYSVDTFQRNGDYVLPQNNPTRWKKVLCERGSTVEVRLWNDTQISYATKYDAAKQAITLSSGANGVLTYTRLPDGVVHLEGTIGGDKVSISMTNSLLLSRGFHWVQEFPMNR
jgi:hypothetical protein